ncbi:MAG: hypothetical protein AAF967_02045 [Pseudomonadota bacterium]
MSNVDLWLLARAHYWESASSVERYRDLAPPDEDIEAKVGVSRLQKFGNYIRPPQPIRIRLVLDPVTNAVDQISVRTEQETVELLAHRFRSQIYAADNAVDEVDGYGDVQVLFGFLPV